MISDAAYWWVIDEIKEGRLPPNERETKEDYLYPHLRRGGGKMVQFVAWSMSKVKFIVSLFFH